MALEILLFITALVPTIAAYRIYFLDTKSKKVAPNRWSWLIWSVATAAEALTYNALNHGKFQTLLFVVGAVACFIITFRVWSMSAWKRPKLAEFGCVLLCLLALVLWTCFQLTWWAHMLVVVAVPVAFIPTWQSAWEAPEREASRAWMLWTIGDAVIILITVSDLRVARDELPYVIMEFLSHATVWGVVSFRRYRLKGGPR